MRLPQLNETTLTPEQRELYDAIVGTRGGDSLRSRNVDDAQGRIQGPFNHMLHVPALGDPMQRLGGVLRFRGELPARARELVILTVARAWESEFEWWAHVRIARDVGVTDAEIEAVFARRTPPLTDPVERAAATAATALCERADRAGGVRTRCSPCRCACSASPSGTTRNPRSVRSCYSA